MGIFDGVASFLPEQPKQTCVTIDDDVDEVPKINVATASTDPVVGVDGQLWCWSEDGETMLKVFENPNDFDEGDVSSIGSDSLGREQDDEDTEDTTIPFDIFAPLPPHTLLGDNIIVNRKSLEKFMCRFACSGCRCVFDKDTMIVTTIGIATKISYECPRCHRDPAIIEPEMVEGSPTEVQNGNWKRRVSSYADNVRLLLLTHLIGGSNEAARVITSFLGLSHTAFKSAWSKMEDEVGVHIRAVTDEIVEENILEECNGVAPVEGGYIPTEVSGDGAWQSGARSHDSNSGQTMLIGNNTKKVVAHQNFSRKCAKCHAAKRKKEVAPKHICPHNYTGSAKGMESTGLLMCVNKLHECNNIVIKRFVIDDDSTTKAVCKHSYKELVANGMMKKEDWPRSKTGLTKKKDYGKLPLTHPVIMFVADLNHRVRTYAGAIWKMMVGTKENKSECNTVDAQRMKRNFSYFLARYSSASREEFEMRSKAVLEHHFNNHEYCDNKWCVWKKKGVKAAEASGKYRCKTKNAKLYTQLKKIHDTYTTKECLDEMHHTLSSQKNESMNRSVMRFAPKTSCFSKSMSLTSRISLAIGINSIGHADYYARLFPLLGIKLDGHCEVFLKGMDKRFNTMLAHKKTKRARWARANQKQIKWRAEALKNSRDIKLGLTYKSGIGMESIGDDLNPTQIISGDGKQCRWCQRTDHVRKSSTKCTYNIKYSGRGKTITSTKKPALRQSSSKRKRSDIECEQDSTLWDGMSLSGKCEDSSVRE